MGVRIKEALRHVSTNRLHDGFLFGGRFLKGIAHLLLLLLSRSALQLGRDGVASFPHVNVQRFILCDGQGLGASEGEDKTPKVRY